MNDISDPKTDAWIDAYRTHGEQEAFARLLMQYSGMLRSKVFGICHTDADGEVMAEATRAFLNAVLAYDPENGATFGAYARSAVEHELFRYAKKKKQREKNCEELPETDDIASDDQGAESSILERERRERLLQNVREVASEQEYRVFLEFWEGNTPRQTARRLGMTEKQVSNAKTRLFAKLRQNPDLWKREFF